MPFKYNNTILQLTGMQCDIKVELFINLQVAHMIT